MEELVEGVVIGIQNIDDFRYKLQCLKISICNKISAIRYNTEHIIISFSK